MIHTFKPKRYWARGAFPKLSVKPKDPQPVKPSDKPKDETQKDGRKG